MRLVLARTRLIQHLRDIPADHQRGGGVGAFKGVYKKATVKVPAKKLKAYKTLLVKKGLPKTAKVKK